MAFSHRSGLARVNCHAIAAAEATSITESKPNPISAAEDAIAPAEMAMIASMLPWAKKLTLFIERPEPVFEVLEVLKDDPSRFVQKSVANHLNDYLKDNRPAAMDLLRSWSTDPTPQRRWTIRHALRNETKRGEDDARAILEQFLRPAD